MRLKDTADLSNLDGVVQLPVALLSADGRSWTATGRIWAAAVNATAEDFDSDYEPRWARVPGRPGLEDIL